MSTRWPTFFNGVEHLTPADVANYCMERRVGRPYASDSEVFQADAGIIERGLLQLIVKGLEELRSKPDAPSPLEIHSWWMRMHYEEAKRALNERIEQILRLELMFDTRLLPDACVVPMITMHRMAVDYREAANEINATDQYCFPRTRLLDELKRAVETLASVKRPSDCIALKGVGKKTLEKIIASAKERKAAKSE